MNVKLPVQLGPKFTLRPGYRYYTPTAVDYFAGYDQHFTTDVWYTCDYDLSQLGANQYSIRLFYTDSLTQLQVLGWGLNAIDLNLSPYQRDTGFRAAQVALGMKMVRK